MGAFFSRTLPFVFFSFCLSSRLTAIGTVIFNETGDTFPSEWTVISGSYTRVTSDYRSAPACCQDNANYFGQGYAERAIDLCGYDAAKIEYCGKYTSSAALHVYYYTTSQTPFLSDSLTPSWAFYSHPGLPVNATKIILGDGGTGKLLFDDFSVIADKKPALEFIDVLPAVGMPGTSFCWRVKYTDSDNDPPAAEFPKLHVLKNGFDISGSPFTMNPENGNIYSYSRALPAGLDYSYYFEASDGWLPAANTPVQNGPVNDSPPVLAWTCEPGYEQSGLNYVNGSTSTVFNFRIKYSDADNDSPSNGYPRLRIKDNGIEIAYSPFTMTETDAADRNFMDGKLYNVSLALPAGMNYSYYFDAADTCSFSTQSPVSPGPVVSNNPLPMIKRNHNVYFVNVYGENTVCFSLIYYDYYNAMPSTGYPVVAYWRGGDNSACAQTLDLQGQSGTGWLYKKQALLRPGVYQYKYCVKNSRCADEYALEQSSFVITRRPENIESAGPAQERPVANSKVVLRWRGTDPDGNTLKFRCYLGADQLSLKPVYEGERDYCELTALNYSGNYIWQVEAVNIYGISSRSPQYSFTTVPKPQHAFNYPNPFNPHRARTSFVFDMADTGSVEISVLSELGDLCWQRSFDGLPKGTNEISYDGKDDHGNVLYNGSYFCVIRKKYQNGEDKDTCRILVLK